MQQLMWCRYYVTGRNKKVYDWRSLSYTRRACKEWWAGLHAHCREDVRERAIREAKYENVLVTIEKLG